MTTNNDSYQYLNLKIDNQIATLSLNRKDVHNAFNPEMIEELISTLSTLGKTDEVRVLVIDSTSKHFCSGGDLNWMRSMANYQLEDNINDARRLALLFKTLATFNKPTISKVKGSVFGGGIGLVACTDFCLSDDSAQFCFSETKLGLVPATISPYVISAIGYKKAMQLFLTGCVFDANFAKEMGLCYQVCKSSDNDIELNSAVKLLTTSLIKNGPNALVNTKKLVLLQNTMINDDIIEKTIIEIANARSSREGQIGLNAFLDKKQPNWTSINE